MSSGYSFCNASDKLVSFRTIRWVKSKMHELSQPVGVPAGALFVIGLCHSACRSSAESKGTVSKYLSKEVDQFLEMVEERAIDVYSFNDKLRRRAQKEGLEKDPLGRRTKNG